MDEVRQMFDRTSRTYDFLNHLFSFTIDKAWRRRLVRKSGAHGGCRVLDLCTGTGDAAIYFAKRIGGAQVTGLDFSPEMLDRGRSKVARAGLSGRVALEEGDALNLRYPAGSFDVVCNSFGLRTLPDRKKAISEMARVASKKGTVLILEFLPPPPTLFGAVYSWHLNTFMPVVGGALSGYRRAYTYLSQTVASFPSPGKIIRLMEQSGLVENGYERLTGGIACLFYGEKET